MPVQARMHTNFHSSFLPTKCNFSVMFTGQVQPNITEPPVPKNVSLSAPVNFTCKVDNGNREDISYRWYKDNVLLPYATQSYYYIQEVTPDKRGNYTCEAISAGGNTTSPPARVDIPGE